MAVAYSITQSGLYEPFELQVARLQILGHTEQNIFAYGTTPATAGTFRTVWENMATTEYVFPSSALTMQLVSAAAGDTASITITGLDANYLIISETLVLNGTTNVPTTKQFFRVNNMVVSSGSATNPAGVVTLSNGGTIYAQINTSVFNGTTSSIGQTQMSVFTVPAGYTFYGYRYGAYSSFNGNTANYTTYRAVTNSSAGVQKVIVQTPFNTAYEVQRHFPLPYAEKTDLRWQIAPSAATAAIVSVNIGGVLISNDVSAQF
ncbi:hypothetical protein UFOVP120_4 [uncultured Caudovirales phage]|uniref:Uncharacterized protein n=1 Tax=uncultured Caudovirales phage TaxID=2100421 RepID=A0A6J5L7X0_9CAUD|nr:hypothetical protein UFOVP120_4 [uncultured Caudovirales phage]